MKFQTSNADGGTFISEIQGDGSLRVECDVLGDGISIELTKNEALALAEFILEHLD